MRKLLARALPFTFLAIMLVATPVLAATIMVSPSQKSGWDFYLTGDATYQFVAGPATPPFSNGSLRLTTGTNGGNIAAVYNANFTARPLSVLTELSYWTYATKAVNPYSPDLQMPELILEVHSNLYGGRNDTLEFYPAYNLALGTPTVNVWQKWNALGGYWFSQKTNLGLRKISDYLTFFPDATIVNVGNPGDPGLPFLGGVRVQLGNMSGATYESYIDGVTIGFGGVSDTYDFGQGTTSCVETDIDDVATGSGRVSDNHDFEEDTAPCVDTD